MKKKTGLALAAFMVLLVGGYAPAWSLTMDDVGSLDFLKAYANVGSSDADELAWMTELGATGPNLSKILLDNGTPQDWPTYFASQWLLVENTTDVYAFDLSPYFSTLPEYFSIKVGQSTLEVDHFFFQNLDSMQYAVVDLSEMGVKNTGNFSHVSIVPEPGTLILLGSGLLGLALAGARKKFRK